MLLPPTCARTRRGSSPRRATCAASDMYARLASEARTKVTMACGAHARSYGAHVRMCAAPSMREQWCQRAGLRDAPELGCRLAHPRADTVDATGSSSSSSSSPCGCSHRGQIVSITLHCGHATRARCYYQTASGCSAPSKLLETDPWHSTQRSQLRVDDLGKYDLGSKNSFIPYARAHSYVGIATCLESKIEIPNTRLRRGTGVD